MGPPLTSGFFDRVADAVARELLGAVIRHESPDGVTSGRIIETEAYLGPHDPASHSVAGRTARTWHMFGPPGTAYVYLSYGLHWCVNAVTREDGYGAAVLIRAVTPLEGVDLMRTRRPKARRDRDLANGPGKVCAAMAITREHDGAALTGGSRLTLHAGDAVPDSLVVVGPRVGITKAVDWPLRFVVR